MAGRELEVLEELFEENRTEDEPENRKLARMNLPSMSISIGEFTTLLNAFKHGNTNADQRTDEEQALDERTVRNHINKILCDCGLSIREDKEKFGAYQSRYGASSFVIGPEFQGLFMTLCDSQYVGGRDTEKKNEDIVARTEYYEKLLSNIQKYLSCSDQDALRSRMEYRNACAFVENCTKANKQYAQIQHMLLHCNPAAEGLLAQKFAQHMQQCFYEFSEIMKVTSNEIPEYIRPASEEKPVLVLHSMNNEMKLPELLLACIGSLARGKKLKPEDDAFINYGMFGRDPNEGETFKNFEVEDQEEKSK